MSVKKPWPTWSKYLTLFLLIALGGLLVSTSVAEWFLAGEGAQELANLLVAGLALISAVAVAVGESVSGIDRRSPDPRVRAAGWFKIIGYAALIASAAYLVALAWAAWRAAGVAPV